MTDRKKKDCHTCMYATHTHGTRKMGQSVIVTSSNSITCTREKVGSLTIDDDGMHCSDYAPAIEGEMDMEFCKSFTTEKPTRHRVILKGQMSMEVNND